MKKKKSLISSLKKSPLKKKEVQDVDDSKYSSISVSEYEEEQNQLQDLIKFQSKTFIKLINITSTKKIRKKHYVKKR